MLKKNRSASRAFAAVCSASLVAPNLPPSAAFAICGGGAEEADVVVERAALPKPSSVAPCFERTSAR